MTLKDIQVELESLIQQSHDIIDRNYIPTILAEIDSLFWLTECLLLEGEISNNEFQKYKESFTYLDDIFYQKMSMSYS